MDLTPTTETDAVAALAIASGALLPEDLALVPKGYSVEDLSRYGAQPRRIKQAVTVRDEGSFDSYLARFADDRLAVFADLDAGTFRAVLDYHVASVVASTAEQAPQWGHHTCTLALTPSEAWKTWTARDGNQMLQTAFAEFIESNALDVTSPTGAALLEAAKNVQQVRNVTFGSKVDLDNGDLVFNYSSETKPKGNVALPERITLAVPVYLGGPRYEVQARVRFRISDDGDLRLWYDLLNRDEVQRAAVEEVLASVREIAGEERVFVGSLA